MLKTTNKIFKTWFSSLPRNQDIVGGGTADVLQSSSVLFPSSTVTYSIPPLLPSISGLSVINNIKVNLKLSIEYHFKIKSVLS